MCSEHNVSYIIYNYLFLSVITSAKEVKFSPEFVCLSVSNITRKVVHAYIFRKCPQWDQEQVNFGGDPYTLSLVTTLAVCLGGGLRSPSAFLCVQLKKQIQHTNLQNTTGW